jgi:adenylylsulfate kinase
MIGRGCDASPAWAIWITGLPGSGKTALAEGAATALRAEGRPVRVLTLDAVRRVVTPTPSYSEAERDLVYRALVYMAMLLTEVGVPVLLDATAHRRAWRELARRSIPKFAEVQLACPLEVCRAREASRRGGAAPPGIYAHAGQPGARVPGVDVPYEPAVRPELTLDTAMSPVEDGVRAVVDLAHRLERMAAPDPRRAREEVPVQVKAWMSPQPITVPPATPITEARHLMQRERIRHLPIVEHDQLVGIVTDRDIRLNLPSPATSLSMWEVNHLLAKLTVGEVMTKGVVTVGSTRSIEAAETLMIDHRIGALPVLEGGRLVGILTETDLLHALVTALRGTPAPDPALTGAPER